MSDECTPVAGLVHHVCSSKKHQLMHGAFVIVTYEAAKRRTQHVDDMLQLRPLLPLLKMMNRAVINSV